MQGIVGLTWRAACQYSSEGWAVYENGQSFWFSIVGSECVTEEGYCWLNHSLFLFPLEQVVCINRESYSWLKDHEVAERRFLVAMTLYILCI